MPPRWVRRLVMPMVVVVFGLVVLVASPALAVLAVLASPLVPGRWVPLRLLGLLLLYLGRECAGMTAAGWLWLASGFGRRLHTPEMQTRHYALMSWFLGGLYTRATKLFNLTVDIEAADDGVEGPHSTQRPVVVLSRHSGPGDSFLLVQLLLDRYHRRPRIVMKSLLELDPCIDMIGHRLPHYFVEPRGRGTADFEQGIGSLAGDLPADGALLLFPEGGNFTRGRRRKAIQKLMDQGQVQEALDAGRLRNLLPPRAAGAFAALSAAPSADVLFVGHTGFGPADDATAVWRAVPTDCRLRLRFWLVPAEDVPSGEDERVDWLYAWWARIDEWIDGARSPADEQAA
ncbi:MAG: 1-acyl-sn-glycerol-3-phosphate acyltransferase [Actinomycetota bacterium]|nr:1-acyl-sn-glycerol-3-phosphate acyltransferase [Actinomycetota bacterium]